MKYTLVYRDKGDGYPWCVRNEQGLYAACATPLPFGGIRRWRSSSEAAAYVEQHMGRDCVWLEAEWDCPYRGGKPGAPSMRHQPVTAGSYKPTHGGYPDSTGGRAGQPLVWPVIHSPDDGSNEEATTVPDSLVQAFAQRVFIVRPRGALKGY